VGHIPQQPLTYENSRTIRFAFGDEGATTEDLLDCLQRDELKELAKRNNAGHRTMNVRGQSFSLTTIHIFTDESSPRLFAIPHWHTNNSTIPSHQHLQNETDET
jgi:hypothetical protein